MSSTAAPERTAKATASAPAPHRPMPAVARHPLRHITQVRVAGVLEADAKLLPALGAKPLRLLMLLQPQRGLPYLAVMELDLPEAADAIHAELATQTLHRGTLLSVAGHGLELHQHEGHTVLKLVHAFGLVIPH